MDEREMKRKASMSPQRVLKFSRGSDENDRQFSSLARKIQRAWRNQFLAVTTQKLVVNFLKIGPSTESVKKMSFDPLVALLREKPIIAAAKGCLQRLHLLCTFRHGSPVQAVSPENVNVRVFLASFMIAFHPANVFENMGRLENSLFECACPLITSFERICQCISASETHSFQEVPFEYTKDFPSQLFLYLKRFKEWKVPDEEKLTCRIKHALLALYQAEEHLPADEPPDSKLKLEFRTQIERLRSKLLQIGGTEALKIFDGQRIAAGGTAAIDCGSSNASSSTANAYAALPGRMTNEQLAHELLLDPTFQLDEHGGCSSENPVYHRIRDSFHQAFWDSLVDDLKLYTPCYVRVLRVLGEIRDGINDLAGSKESGSVSETIDLEFIKLQAEKSLFGWSECKSLISGVVSVIQRTQAPTREEETIRKWKDIQSSLNDEGPDFERPRLFCKALEFLLERVNAMRIDAANNRLRLIAPVINDHGIDYERGKFQDKLKDGTLTLSRTKVWLARTFEKEIERKCIDLKALLDGAPVAFTNLHCAGMASLIIDPNILKIEACPETLLFDVSRLCSFQAEFQYIVKSSTLLITASHFLPPTKQQNADILLKIEEMLSIESPREVKFDEVLFETDKLLDSSALSTELQKQVHNALHRCIDPNDAVYRLIGERMRIFFTRYLKNGKPEDLKFVSAAKNLVPRMDKAASNFSHLAKINRAVHQEWYNQLIHGLALKYSKQIDTAEKNSLPPAE